MSNNAWTFHPRLYLFPGTLWSLNSEIESEVYFLNWPRKSISIGRIKVWFSYSRQALSHETSQPCLLTSWTAIIRRLGMVNFRVHSESWSTTVRSVITFLIFAGHIRCVFRVQRKNASLWETRSSERELRFQRCFWWHITLTKHSKKVSIMSFLPLFLLQSSFVLSKQSPYYQQP